MDLDYPKQESRCDLLAGNDIYKLTVEALLYHFVQNSHQASIYELEWTEKIIRYLKQWKPDLQILPDRAVNLIGYAYAYSVCDLTDRSSTCEQVFFVEGSTVPWARRKQTYVALSPTKADNVTAAYASQGAIWLQRVLYDFG